MAQQLPRGFAEQARPVPSEDSGYIQAIDTERLIELATRQGMVVHLARRPGDFVAESSALARAWPAEKLDEATLAQINDCYFFGWHRTPTQDIEYSIDQLVEVAVRALSPGVNDPFTAMSCVEWLGVALILVGQRQIPSACHYDESSHLRLVSNVTDYAGIAAAAFNQIRQYGCSSVAVVTRLLDVIARATEELKRSEDRAVLFSHAKAVREDGLGKAQNDRDRHDIEIVFNRVLAALQDEPSG